MQCIILYKQNKLFIMKHLHFHPHHHQTPFHLMHEFVGGRFDETSPLRKLFNSNIEFEFCIDTVTKQGPIHECVNMVLVLKSCERLLSDVQQNGIEIKPIQGLVVKSYSPFAEMTLPLCFPESLLGDMDYTQYIGEGPIERVLSNLLITNVLYYFDLYFQTIKQT